VKQRGSPWLQRLLRSWLAPGPPSDNPASRRAPGWAPQLLVKISHRDPDQGCVSLGVRGAHLTFGRRRATIGLPASGLSYSVYERYHRVTALSARFGLLVVIPILVAIAAIVLVVLIIGPALDACEHASAARAAPGTPARSRRPNADPR